MSQESSNHFPAFPIVATTQVPPLGWPSDSDQYLNVEVLPSDHFRSLWKDQSRLVLLEVPLPLPAGSLPCFSHWPGPCGGLCSSAGPQSRSWESRWGWTSHSALKTDRSAVQRCYNTQLTIQCREHDHLSSNSLPINNHILKIYI